MIRMQTICLTIGHVMCQSHNNHDDHTIFQIWLAEVEVLAGAGWAFLRSQWEAHALDLLAQGIERAKDLLHTLISSQELCARGVGSLSVSLREHLTGVDGALGLLGDLNGQWLDDITRGTLKQKKNSVTFQGCRNSGTC